MPNNGPRLIGEATIPDEACDLLKCRMAMLGLDPIKVDDGGTFHEIMRRCLSCDDRESCAVDFKRDPNNPVWESCCPNAAPLIALAGISWMPE